MRKLLAIGLLTFLAVPFAAEAQLSPGETGLTDTGQAAYGGDALTLGEFVGSRIIAPLFGVMGVIFLLLVVYAGFLWMTAAGNATQTGKAKDILVAAIIGTVIALSAFAITTFIFQNLSAQTTQAPQG